MRQAAEDVSAHSAVKEESVGPISFIRNKWQTSRLRRAVEEVAKKNFPEEERQNLTEVVMNAFENRELDEDKLRRSWDKKSLYLFGIMKKEWNEIRLRSAAQQVAKKNFPEEERQYLTDAVMKAHQHGELDEEKLRRSWFEKSLYLFATMRKEWNEKRLRSAAEEVAKEFPEKERQLLTEAVMKAFKNGELDKGLKEMSREEKQRYLLTTMQQMREEYLRSFVENVAMRFPEPEEERYHLTEAVMNAFKNGKLDEDKLRRSWDEKSLYLFAIMEKEWNERRLKSAVEYATMRFPTKERAGLEQAVMNAFYNGELDKGFMSDRKYLVQTMQRMRELPVAASAIKFCSNLFREANKAGQSERESRKALVREAQEAEGICHKVLTGDLGFHDGPKWAEKAAKSSQPEGQHLKLGRLQKVNATEKAWNVSLKNVCRDECQELVKEMRKVTVEVLRDVGRTENPPSYEEACAKRVVQKVEAEILGCCAEKCGWNGRACMLWPFLNGTEKGQWEAECCTEFNILKNSSRATMCDATLTGKENNEVIRDGQPNSKEDREMIGQDPVLKGTSFLQSEEVNEPIPPPEGTCPPPLDLGKVHEKLKHEWKTTNFQLAKNNFKKPFCVPKRPEDLIGKCTAFLPQDVNGPYICYADCLESVKGLKFNGLTDEVQSSKQILYVHKSIHGE